jgi:hypothetical protein
MDYQSKLVRNDEEQRFKNQDYDVLFEWRI